MLPWKESHYARATEFAGLIANALGRTPMPLPHSPVIASPHPHPPTAIPQPSAPSAAAVFKNIPWKK